MEKIVVTGSLHYDIFVEAPHRPQKGETVQGFKWYPKFGGKGGNQAVSAAKAGALVTMVGAVGNDSFADDILKVLKSHLISTDYIQKVSDKSGMSVAIADSDGDYGAVIVSGANRCLDLDKIDFAKICHGASMLILQNEINEKTNIKAATLAKSLGVKVCLNAAPAKDMSKELEPLIDILVVNEVEASQILKAKVSDLKSAQDAAVLLAKTYPMVVITAGSHGAAYAQKDHFGSVLSHKVKVVSTHGAGDCFVGRLCVRLAAGSGLKNAVEYANDEAAKHVSSLQEDYLAS